MATISPVGFKFPARKVSWLQRDVLLFANSINVEADDLHLLFELHPKFAVFPSYPIVLSQKGTSPELADFYAEYSKNTSGVPLPGVPPLDIKRMVDAGRVMTFLKPLPPSSVGRDFELQATILGVYDKGKTGTVVQTETALVDIKTGHVYTKVVGNSFYLGQGGWGGPKGPSPPVYTPPSHDPDVVYEIQTSKSTALLYRLNGDSNPLHATPEPGKKMGFKGAIIHGLWTYNATAYAVLRSFAGSDPARLCHFEAKFASPIYPGDKVIIHMWKTEKTGGNGNDEEIRFVVKVAGGKPALTNGRAILQPSLLTSKM